MTDDAPPNDVAVIGAETDLGKRICQMIASVDPGSRVLAVCRVGTGSTARQAGIGSVIEVDLHAEELDLHAVLSSVREVVHLAPSGGPDLDGTGVGGVDVAGTVRLFAAMSDLGIRRATVLSSAMVYGPWSTNPIPITESAPVNPHPDLPYASRKAEVERVARDWLAGKTGSPGRRSLCVLRPTVMVSPDDPDWLSRSLWNASGVAAEVVPPVQFLHRDDLASAVALSVVDSFEGVYNVAPDGWVSGERIRALAGRQARVEVTRAVVARVGALRWLTGTTTTPPEVTPYTLEPWVVANDRLKAEGWVPKYSNEEAYVAAAPAGPLALLGSQRRQELALGAAGGVGALGAAALGAGVAWARRR